MLCRARHNIFYGVIIDLSLAVGKMRSQRFPLVEQVGASLAEERLGQNDFLQSARGFFQQGEGQRKMTLAQSGAQVRPVHFRLIPHSLVAIKLSDQPQDKTDPLVRLALCFKKYRRA